MGKKGFTITELVAVISIMAMVAAIATISITRYRKMVEEKEITNTKQAIIGAFQNYRVDNLVGEKEKVKIADLKFTNKLNYAGDNCSDEELLNSTICYTYKTGSKEEVFHINLTCANKVISSDNCPA